MMCSFNIFNNQEKVREPVTAFLMFQTPGQYQPYLLGQDELKAFDVQNLGQAKKKTAFKTAQLSIAKLQFRTPVVRDHQCHPGWSTHWSLEVWWGTPQWSAQKLKALVCSVLLEFETALRFLLKSNYGCGECQTDRKLIEVSNTFNWIQLEHGPRRKPCGYCLDAYSLHLSLKLPGLFLLW